jgi:hypothetical protein
LPVVKLKYQRWRRKRFVCDGVKSVSQVSQSVENCSRKTVAGWRQADDSVLSCLTCFASVELFRATALINHFFASAGIQFFSPQADCLISYEHLASEIHMRTPPEQPGIYSEPLRCSLSKKVLCRSNFFQEFKV